MYLKQNQTRISLTTSRIYYNQSDNNNNFNNFKKAIVFIKKYVNICKNLIGPQP
jgi:hypothetical protein